MTTRYPIVTTSSLQLRTNDGLDLFVRIAGPPQNAEQSRSMFFVHGACEHSGRYELAMQQAALRGWTAYAMDLRGHGQSTGQLVHVETFDDYINDLQFAFSELNLDTQSTVLVGSSMGGLVSLRTVQENARRIGDPFCAGLVLLSPLFGIKHPIEG